MSNPFWDFSIERYQRPGVAELLIRLQDEAGADVNMLLLVAWLAQQSRQLSDEQLVALITRHAGWRSQCLIPLRGVRRYLKDHDSSEKLYEQAKALELAAEEVQQNEMYKQVGQISVEVSGEESCALLVSAASCYLAKLPGIESAAWREDLYQLAQLLLAS